MLKLGPRRLIFDVLPEELVWIEARDTFAGARKVKCGRMPLADSSDVTSRVARLIGRVSRPQVDAVLWSSVNVQIERVDLPATSAYEARSVAQRKIDNLHASGPPGESEVSSHVFTDASGSTVWTCSAPSSLCEEAATLLGYYGLKPDRLVPIRPLTDLSSMDEELVLLIGAWNFADELTRKVRRIVEGTRMEGRLTLIAHQPVLRTL